MTLAPPTIAPDICRLDPTKLPMSRWPLELFPYEPAYSWIKRAAAANHALSTDAFIWSLGQSGRDWDYEALLEIAQQLPISYVDQMRWSTPRQAGTNSVVCGHRISSKFFAKNRRRVCPVCLDENRYSRVWFDLVLVAACPFHDAELIDGLSDDPLDDSFPECGWTQNGVKITRDHAISKEASDLDKHIVSALTSQIEVEPCRLAAENLNAALHGAVTVGKLFLGWSRFGQSQSELRHFAQLGFAPLRSGTEALVDFLTDAPGLRRGSPGLGNRLRHSSALVRTVESENLRELIAKSFGIARIRNRLSTPSGRLARLEREAGFWNLQSSAEALGLDSINMRKVFCALGIISGGRPSTHAFRVSPEELLDAKQYIESSLSADQVAEKLGCTPADLDELVQRKLIRVDFRTRHDRFFHVREIEAFVERALGAQAKPEYSEAIPLGDFIQKAGLSRAASYSLIVRKKSVRVVHHDHDRQSCNRYKGNDRALGIPNSPRSKRG